MAANVSACGSRKTQSKSRSGNERAPVAVQGESKASVEGQTPSAAASPQEARFPRLCGLSNPPSNQGFDQERVTALLNALEKYRNQVAGTIYDGTRGKFVVVLYAGFERSKELEALLDRSWKPLSLELRSTCKDGDEIKKVESVLSQLHSQAKSGDARYNIYFDLARSHFRVEVDEGSVQIIDKIQEALGPQLSGMVTMEVKKLHAIRERGTEKLLNPRQ